MDQKQLRQTAFIARISDLKKGQYIKEDGWEPNYILTKKAKINRVNIIGIVISKISAGESSFENLVIDDGNGNINVRSFEKTESFNEFNVGDILLIIGRPREYGNEKYLVPEIIKKINNNKWLIYRKKELELFDLKNPDNDVVDSSESNIVQAEEEIISSDVKEDIVRENIADRIVKVVRDKDQGEGADIEEVISKMKNQDAENIIQLLLKQGEIFELKPGKLKVLE